MNSGQAASEAPLRLTKMRSAGSWIARCPRENPVAGPAAEVAMARLWAGESKAGSPRVPFGEEMQNASPPECPGCYCWRSCPSPKPPISRRGESLPPVQYRCPTSGCCGGSEPLWPPVGRQDQCRKRRARHSEPLGCGGNETKTVQTCKRSDAVLGETVLLLTGGLRDVNMDGQVVSLR